MHFGFAATHGGEIPTGRFQGNREIGRILHLKLEIRKSQIGPGDRLLRIVQFKIS
jgi:hypothetical protein